MNKQIMIRVAVAAAGAALAATATALDALDFVAGWPIAVPNDARVFDVPLTAEVYAAAENLEQLAVLDANGAPQPFFRRSPAKETSGELHVSLEASPLYASTARSGVDVGVTSTERSTSVNVTTAGPPPPPAITAFVLDARAVDVTPAALELDWSALPQPFLLDVVVEQSTDLTNWRYIGNASVAALSIGGAEVRHARVPVRAHAGGYLRVTPRGAVAGWRLLRAALVGAAVEPVPQGALSVPPLPVSAAPRDGPPGALYFDAGGPLPVASIRLKFGDGDGWVRADVAASRSLEGPWLPVAYGELAYALSFEGRQLASEPIAVGRHEARYWRLVPAAPPRGEPIELTLEFPQEHLRVAAGGAAPYLLAAGTLAKEAGPDGTLAQVWSRLEPPAETVAFATLGERRDLGGPDALRAVRAFSWRMLALWAVLIGGVLVVATMAVRLVQEMRSQPS
jgi:hypothetical protein